MTSPGPAAVLAFLVLLACLVPSSVARHTAVGVSYQDIENTLRQNNASLWLDVLNIADVKTVLRPAPARYAAFVPTDAAVQSFLQRMGLTMSDLAARPALAKHLIAQHLVLALPPATQQQLLEGKLAPVATANTAPGTLFTGVQVQLMKPQQQRGQSQQQGQQQGKVQSQPRVFVTDALDQRAESIGIARLDANKTVVFIDRVLASGHYYSDFASLCKHRQAAAAPMCEALVRSGVLQDPSSPRFAHTVFFPGSMAFRKAGLQPQAVSKAELDKLVRYHIVPGVHAFPGFNGSFETLLQGDKLQVVVDRPPTRGLDSSNSSAYVVPADKQQVPVVVYNVFVGQGVVQGIPAVLVPPGFTATPASGAPSRGYQNTSSVAAAIRAALAGLTQQGAKQQQGRQLLGCGTSVRVTPAESRQGPPASTSSASPAAAAADADDNVHMGALEFKGYIAAIHSGSSNQHHQQHSQHHHHHHQQQQQQQQPPARRLLGGGVSELSKVTMPFNSAESAIRDQVRTMGREFEDRWQ